MVHDVRKYEYPKEVGYYYVKVLYEDNKFMEYKYLWNGKNFVLPIGRSFTDEVVAWKE